MRPLTFTTVYKNVNVPINELAMIKIVVAMIRIRIEKEKVHISCADIVGRISHHMTERLSCVAGQLRTHYLRTLPQPVYARLTSFMPRYILVYIPPYVHLHTLAFFVTQNCQHKCVAA